MVTTPISIVSDFFSMRIEFQLLQLVKSQNIFSAAWERTPRNVNIVSEQRDNGAVDDDDRVLALRRSSGSSSSSSSSASTF